MKKDKTVPDKLKEAAALLETISDNLKYALRNGNHRVLKETVLETIKMLQ